MAEEVAAGVAQSSPAGVTPDGASATRRARGFGRAPKRSSFRSAP